jgi:hypothetical protein
MSIPAAITDTSAHAELTYRKRESPKESVGVRRDPPQPFGDGASFGASRPDRQAIPHVSVKLAGQGLEIKPLRSEIFQR